MNPKRSQRFKVVLMLAERQEQEAAVHLGNYQQKFIAEQSQLAQLSEYNRDYIDQVNARCRGIKRDELIGLRQFLQHLGEAEREQTKKIEQLSQVIERLRQEWYRRHQYRQSIEALIERCVREEDHQLEKRLERELDEMVSQNRSRTHQH